MYVLAIHILTTKEKYIEVFYLKHVRKLMALKIHAIINTCYKLFINDSTEKKDTCLTITLLKVGNEANCF